MSKTILILSGTAEGFALAQQLHEEHPNWRIISSLAGRTKNPNLPIGEIRIGGFGGTEGLIDYISKQKVDKIIDATHPYAKTISENAERAAKDCAIEYQKIERPAWQQTDGDNWTEVQSIKEAADILPKNATVFLALGRQYIDAFQHRSDCHFIVRMVDHSDDVPLSSYKLILGRPNVNSEDERQLFFKHKITHLIARNSGGEKSYAKIIAARDAKIQVIMIQRPKD